MAGQFSSQGACSKARLGSLVELASGPASADVQFCSDIPRQRVQHHEYERQLFPSGKDTPAIQDQSTFFCSPTWMTSTKSGEHRGTDARRSSVLLSRVNRKKKSMPGAMRVAFDGNKVKFNEKISDDGSGTDASERRYGDGPTHAAAAT